MKWLVKCKYMLAHGSFDYPGSTEIIVEADTADAAMDKGKDAARKEIAKDRLYLESDISVKSVVCME